MKTFAVLAALSFGYFASLQFNDPDPIRWIAVYTGAAIVSATSVFVPVPGWAFGVLASVAGLWAATLVPEILYTGVFSGNEPEREFGGLVLVVAASVILWRSRTRVRD